MQDADLRLLFPVRIVRGALLRPDGVAAGLVVGGAPAWDLREQESRSRLGADYHRLLLALDAPIDVYIVDQPPDLSREVAALRSRQSRAAHPLLAGALDGIAGYLAELAQSGANRAKDVVWVVTAGQAGPHTGRRPTLSRLAPRRGAGGGERAAPKGQAQLTDAVERARRLADALGQLGGTPQPRLMEAEEIARLLYTLADPIRAGRYPLAGPLLDRVRRVVTVGDGRRP
jgi:hypothetical protein